MCIKQRRTGPRKKWQYPAHVDTSLGFRPKIRHLKLDGDQDVDFDNIIGFGAVLVAIIGLYMQQQAAANNARIATLAQLVQLLDRRLDENEHLIEVFKRTGKSWSGLMEKNQKTIKPLRADLQALLVRQVRVHAREIDYAKLDLALNLPKDDKNVEAS